ncbi:hypothetical protein ACRASX_07545 [Flavobacterium sp. TMP13]|uniref:DUF7793 family protein n=1 Tax=Flavobacterium sp. TMP13 TaxID=3425950 RepID=UPI003D77068C
MTESPDCYENQYARFWIADGILFFVYKENVCIDRAAAQQIVSDRIHFQNEKSYPILCDIRTISCADKVGRDYLAQSGSVFTKAVALLTNQQVSLTISSFYLEISKPAVPTQVFIVQQEAIAFLQNYV